MKEEGKPTTWNDLRRRLNEEVSNLEHSRKLVQTSILEHEGKRFKDAGGCQTCHGRGWVVTWDTMDSLSGCYAEYGNCSSFWCTKESREKTGLDLTVNSKYDELQGTGVPDLIQNLPAYQVLVLPFDREITRTMGEVAGMNNRCIVDRGTLVYVGNGRSKGLIGRVAYINAAGKALVKDADRWQDRSADGKWVSTKDLEAVVES